MAAWIISSLANFLLIISRKRSEPLSTAIVIDLVSLWDKILANFSVTVLVLTEAIESLTPSNCG